MSDLSESLRAKYDVMFSTDIVGLMGDPLHAFQFWSQVCNHELNFGIEAIALLPAMPRLTPRHLGHFFSQMAGFP